jgi:AcrR family transcriptional regulator
MPPVPAKRLRGGRHDLSREEVVGSQRRRLLDATVNAVAERGYAATTVADVIARAGVSRSTFYEQFADKEDCFVAAHKDLIDRLVSYVSSAYASAETLADKVRLGLRAFLEALAARPEGARYALVEVMAAGPRAHEQHRAAVSAFVRFFGEARELADNGEELPASLSHVVVGGVTTLVFEEVIAGRAQSLPKLLPELVYLALVPYVGHERALSEMDRAAAEMGEAASRSPEAAA